MHRDYIKRYNPIRFNGLCISGELWTYLADLNEQAQSRLELIIEQMKAAEGLMEDLKQHNQTAWAGAMNNIQNRAEEIILTEIICFAERRPGNLFESGMSILHILFSVLNHILLHVLFTPRRF